MGVVEGEEEVAEEADEFGEVFVEVVFGRRVGGVGHGSIIYGNNKIKAIRHHIE